MNTDDLSEIERRPHQVSAEADAMILDGLAQITFKQQRQIHALKIDLLFHQGLITALAEGSQARVEGKPIEANPYVPDEPDGKWPFWRQGWNSANPLLHDSPLKFLDPTP